MSKNRIQSALESTPASHQWLVIANRLWSWEKTADKVDEDGRREPSASAIKVAERLAKYLRAANDGSPASRVTGDGDGGIVFELSGKDNFSASFEISRSGVVEFFSFDGTVIVKRQILNEASIPAPVTESAMS